MVAVQHRLGLERRRVGARRRLGQAIAADPLHRDHRRQILLLHLGRAEAVDHPARHVVDRDEGAGRGAAVGHRLHDQRRFEPAEADAAALLGDVDRAEAELGRLADRVAREDVLLVPLGGVRRDRVGGELARHLLDLELVVGEVELGHCAGALARGFLLKQSFEPQHVANRRALEHPLAEGAEVRPLSRPIILSAQPVITNR